MYLPGILLACKPTFLITRGSGGHTVASPGKRGRENRSQLCKLALPEALVGRSGRNSGDSSKKLFLWIITAASGSTKKDDWKLFRKTT